MAGKGRRRGLARRRMNLGTAGDRFTKMNPFSSSALAMARLSVGLFEPIHHCKKGFMGSEVISMEVSQKIHFIGIGGSGMSALARVLHAKGIDVSGSDIEETSAVRALRKIGVEVAIGHDPENVDGAASVVYSTAIDPSNPEITEAKRRGIPLKHRSEVLADLLNEKHGIAVAGAHGKTTVTSMLSWTLYHLGKDPTFLIGGELPGLGGAMAGNSSLLVAEADESDRSFLRYRPYIAIVTSIEPDHLENYGDSFDSLKEGYLRFLKSVKADGRQVLCADDPIVLDVGSKATQAKSVTYGFDKDAYYRGTNLRFQGFTTQFDCWVGHQPIGSFTLSVPGRHNVQNALACIAVCDQLGVDLEKVRHPLSSFRGARRRFEVISSDNGVLIVDDYAHHPSEIKAVLRAAKEAWDRRVVAVFQPHRYSRTAQLMDEFAQSFEEADAVVLTEVYAPPPETPIPGVSGISLAERTRRRLGRDVVFAPTLDEAVACVKEMIQPGDMVLTMGAGDVWKAARALAEGD